ncbi:hypothetical protein [Streptomyces roseochromogenus]|uniref:Uncharacterized protein n=1 Tax=Streptomyces roseochromogenus subsp. oscitans DS 12.976 TaxID=1352936 RepID=V6KVT7_STRRC|nr:hypothetical protein [Streptomyces roseochromogenus]EST36265.1 hypothetical protein M878_02845 [Streptomyces roseochromogenus subsp. oscitans DS 12.976]
MAGAATPVWWAWSQHAARLREIEHRARDARFAPLATPRFRRPDEPVNWLTSLDAAEAGSRS